jgi:hypothetical protein
MGLPGEQQAQRGADPHESRQGERRAAVRDEPHPGEGGGEARTGGRDAEIARQREVESEAGGGAVDDRQHRDRAAHDGEHGSLEIGEAVLQHGHRRHRPQPAQPVEIEPGRKVPAGAAQHHQLRLPRLGDALHRPGDSARQVGCQGVAAGGPVDREEVDGPVGAGQQLVGHRSALQGGRAAASGIGLACIICRSPASCRAGPPPRRQALLQERPANVTRTAKRKGRRERSSASPMPAALLVITPSSVGIS